MEINQVYTIDAAEGLNQIEDDSIDLIVTDPPYGGGFMGLDWDMKLPRQRVWDGSFRVLKPGSFAFINCSPRLDLVVEMGISLMRAGFETRFTSLYWAHAQGFPKALNISKAIDRKAGAKRKIIGYDKEWQAKANKNKFDQFKSINKTKRGINTAEFFKHTGEITEPATNEAKELDGSYAGFQPKPVVEAILVVMKPLDEQTYVEQALKNRKGITWLDDGRIPVNPNEQLADRGFTIMETEGKKVYGRYNDTHKEYDKKGRFPANLLVSDDVLNDGQKWDKGGSVECGGVKQNKIYEKDMNEDQSEFEAYNDGESFSRYFDLDRWWEEKIKELPREVQRVFPFLLVSKASKAERNLGVEDLEKEVGHNRFDTCEKCGGYIFQNKNRPSACKCEVPVRKHNVMKGNYHPTVKPVALGSYLVTIGSRVGDLVVDPFCGSGAYLISCKIWRRNYIGFDIREDYVEELAKPRLAAIPNQQLIDEYI